MQIFETTDAIFSKAQRRNLLGSPPFSSGKKTICDEVIWETLLNNVKFDLIIATRDMTYHDNYQYFKFEFHRHTNHALRVTTQVSEAIKLLGLSPSPEFIDQEKQVEELTNRESHLHFISGMDLHQCPRCRANSECFFTGRCEHCGYLVPY